MEHFIKIAVCDDELYFINEIHKKIKEYMELKKIAYSLTNYLYSEQLLSTAQIFDIILLDIKMSGLNGMETAKMLRIYGIKSHIIFITALKEYVFDAFDVDATNYILKPINYDKLFVTLDKIINKITIENELFLSIGHGKNFKRIKLSDILYCEAVNRNVLIYTVNETERFNSKLEDLEKLLNQNFFRCHRSYILNIKYVKSYESGFACLMTGEKIPIAKRRKQDFSKAVLIFHRKEVR